MHRVMLDVDLAMGAPGSDIDDGFALALALADPDISLELVTCVNGNTDVATATALTLELLRRLGHEEVPVHRGAQVPLLRPRARQGEIPAEVTVREPRPGPAAVAMVELARDNPGQITCVAVGPLTNVALAMRLDPEFAANLAGLVIMGGVFNEHTHSATMPGEFNVWCDPEAAAVVLGSGIQARWVGLDVTRKVRVTREQSVAMEASDRPFVSFAGRYTTPWIDLVSDRHAEEGASCAMHDPLAVAAVTHPELIEWRTAQVAVETGDRSRGAMVTDYLTTDWSPDETSTPRRANALVAQTVRAEDFNRLFLDALSRL